ncbi:hypothetical protein UCRPA7_3680 [Phaeoacremonium minimum UCRPA7]|uniref:Uncharacterized protein n=1 Tax=Phaeoacremonium minimum (strain UCR-PA7) TaxID=1286976 RepID=R8BN24_PHAM7|nr:hypothetical protein UCRPA7_3680 [Phaeoacremonium minimum UCRPA7]EOO00751.1 hypothetical protein UCRPA7_3680 [Phaeoacremonium minimum UCRPA7]
MKGRPVDQLVYEYMFPKPRPSDPQNFHALLQRHLILEVRQEVHSFYGHLDTPEAKYPGLDYCHPTHRIRLSRWQWHRRLFRAFDALRLTANEIAGLTKWEGTKWAKERYEKEQGVKIRDTVADELADWIEPEERRTPARTIREATQETEDRGEAGDENMAEESEEEMESVGFALNQRLRERVAMRETGDSSMPLDEEWEQWLKNAIETGELPLVADQIARMTSERAPMSPDELFPARMMVAARAGQWHEIPDFLHDMIRASLEAQALRERQQQRLSASSETGVSTPSSSRLGVNPSTMSSRSSRGVTSEFSPTTGWRRTYSDLRLPVGDGGTTAPPRVHRTAQPGA